MISLVVYWGNELEREPWDGWLISIVNMTGS